MNGRLARAGGDMIVKSLPRSASRGDAFPAACRRRGARAVRAVRARIFTCIRTFTVAHTEGARRGRRPLEDHADDHLAVAIHLVEHARAHALRLEDAAYGGFELDDEEVHAPVCG